MSNIALKLHDVLIQESGLQNLQFSMTFSIKSVLIHECQYKPTQINTIQHASDKVGISFKSQYYLKVIKKLVLIIIKS